MSVPIDTVTGALRDGAISRQLHLGEYSNPTGKPDEAKVSRPVWSRGKAARPDLLLREIQNTGF